MPRRCQINLKDWHYPIVRPAANKASQKATSMIEFLFWLALSREQGERSDTWLSWRLVVKRVVGAYTRKLGYITMSLKP